MSELFKRDVGWNQYWLTVLYICGVGALCKLLYCLQLDHIFIELPHHHFDGLKIGHHDFAHWILMTEEQNFGTHAAKVEGNLIPTTKIDKFHLSIRLVILEWIYDTSRYSTQVKAILVVLSEWLLQVWNDILLDIHLGPVVKVILQVFEFWIF